MYDIGCDQHKHYCLMAAVDEKGKYAVVGLPCHLHGIRKLEIINKTALAADIKE